MRLVHFQGYGTVTVKLLYRIEGFAILIVEGEHETGLVLRDNYRLAQWIGRESLGNFKAADIEQVDILTLSDSRVVYIVRF